MAMTDLYAERGVNRLAFGLALALAMSFGSAAMALDDDAARASRWADLRQTLFGDKQVQNGDGKIALEAPDRALDAALVPVTISVQNPKDVKAVYLVIDDNPAPVAAHVTYGPAGDPRVMKLRVRINQYTYMHAVEETMQGELYETSRFIKASGGCSAPAGSYDEAALADIGHMKLRQADLAGVGDSFEAQLLIRHPNFNGMQMDQITRLYTPARFLKSIEVSHNGYSVLRLESDISLATDPAITFAVKGAKKGKLAITAKDSESAVFEHVFDLDQRGS
jgi:sulfur-oxidizing protein SoxY